MGGPILFAIGLSLTNWGGFGAATFTGPANYTRMFNDPVAQRAFVVTILYAVAMTVLQTIIPLVVAVLVDFVWNGLSVVVRTILFIPAVVSFVVSGVLWKLIYDPNIGTLNQILKTIGLGQLAQPWLSNPATVLPSILVVSLWGALGLNMLIFFAGIQGVDPTLYEAAQVDGASRVQQFFYITIPGLRVITAIVVALNLMNGFKVFDIIYVMTGGGPASGTQTVAFYTYQQAFSNQLFGYGAALAYLIVLAVFALAMVYLRMLRQGQMAGVE